jgi:plastocyanin
MRIRILVFSAVAALVVVGLTSAMTVPKLKGTVGPGFTITLKNAKGQKVTKLKRGKYGFVISDKASIHNFTLEKVKGGTFEKALTGVSFVGTKTVTVKLTKGKWKYYCAPHESSIFGFFTVG